VIGQEPASLPERLATEITRVSERLRTLPLTRLSAPVPPYPSRAAAAHALAQRLAVAAQGIESRATPEPPAWREVPRLADHAAGDQVAVTGRDLLDALAATGPDDDVWTPNGPRRSSEVVEELIEALATLRRTL
jgi:hypothetical protein